MDIPSLYSLYLKCTTVATDTRKLTTGALYFALKGANFDGNLFAVEALRSGASYAVVDDTIDTGESIVSGERSRIIVVEDALYTLQELARFHRDHLTIPVIGITGSNGKTTTKELLANVLAKKFKVFATQGNLNNHIGVPLSILSIGSDAGIAIIEMGANHQKEVAFLCSICKPTCGLITNVGLAHLEGFGGFEGVKKGKKELYDWLEGKPVFVYADSDDLLEMSKKLEHRFFYGSDLNYSISAVVIEQAPFLHFQWRLKEAMVTYDVQTHLAGEFNLPNALAAIACGNYFGISPEQISAGIKGYDPVNQRSQIKVTPYNRLLLDLYNANPSSMSAALSAFKKQEGSRMAILGDMFELGDESTKEHERIIRLVLLDESADFLLVGAVFASLAPDYSLKRHLRFFSSTEHAGSWLSKEKLVGKFILIKGSRGMHLETLLEHF